MRCLILYILVFLLFLPVAYSQEKILNEGQSLLIRLDYGGQLPSGDLAKRFGFSYSVGSQVHWFSKKNFVFGIKYDFQFGTQVKVNPLSGLQSPEGFIFGNNKTPANVRLRQRGFSAIFNAGKVIVLNPDYNRSGLLLMAGIGLLQHKIRIQEDPESFVPQIAGDYKKGYDQLSNGLAFYQFVGYQFLGADKRLNFYIGLEAIQAATRNRRDLNFDTFTKDSNSYKDLMFGFKVGWIIPLYFGEGNEILY